MSLRGIADLACGVAIIMAKLRKKRCCVCKKGFWPHPRVGDRQRACRKPDCQKDRRAETQARWRQRNPDYWRARRLQMRSATAKEAQQIARGGAHSAAGGATRRPPPPRGSSQLGAIPWDLAQDEIGVATTDFLALVVRLVLVFVQDQIRAQSVDSS